ncbi:pyruvate dehydrogenase complex dihydrolipoamide acetyltransferase [Salibacter halophilus]|uniref:Acetyltransferase component of pyruvate dehydrogenase complex n=1 Tax=Salibacter halophilus TaxID=1803916 RepID=A0A6N6MCK6_9FLAO|nr:pyruvate dehydrogenase complex dihydrolipoamide acetyltransferase [Salibacter halophilus]KAB1066287.1 pyruvate dehydrogenase complex dihydrolipoamide acetyltransferase [Salibacter halophilus]
MAEVVRMPKLSDTMEEGVVAEWHKSVGDQVESGDLLAEIETDKATMEFESFQEGTLLHIGVEKGDSAPVDSILAILGEEGEDVSDILEEEEKKQADSGSDSDDKAEKKEEKGSGKEEQKEETKKAEPKPTATKEEKPAKRETPRTSSGRIKASPLAKKLAEDKGINLENVEGSGDGGRIVKRDIDNYEPSSAAAQPAAIGQESYSEQNVSQMRKTIAKRLSESKFTAPHFYLTVEIDMDNVMKARKAVNEQAESKVSFNDFVIKAASIALTKHPYVNASWREDKIRFNEHVHMGVAVAVEEGLLVPVVRHANGKTLTQISSEVKEYAQRAKDKKLQPEDWEGNTFTISNLGMFGIEEFTAIINPPDSCILAVGGIVEKPVVKDGQVVPGNRMKVTLSCDHRVVDGVKGAEFLNTFKSMLENPVMMLA